MQCVSKLQTILGVMSPSVITGAQDMMGCEIVASLLWDILVGILRCAIMRQLSDESEILRERRVWGG